MTPFAVLNSLVSYVKNGSLRAHSVMILVVLSTYAELASATARGARIVKRENSKYIYPDKHQRIFVTSIPTYGIEGFHVTL